MSAERDALRRIKNASGHFYDMGDERGELIGSAHSGRGLVWVATGCHTIAVNFHTDRPAGWRDLLSDIRLGTEACTHEECEQCAEPEGLCGDATCLICNP